MFGVLLCDDKSCNYKKRFRGGLGQQQFIMLAGPRFTGEALGLSDGRGLEQEKMLVQSLYWNFCRKDKTE